MTHLSYEGQVLEISSEALAVWAISMMISPLEMIGTVYWALYFAMPGKYVGDSLRLFNKGIQHLKENLTIVDNARIQYAIKLILPRLEAFVSAVSDARSWQVTHISRRIRIAHNKAVRQKGPLIPPWYNEEEFRKILETCASAFSLYLDALTEIIPLIREIQTSNFLKSSPEQLDRTLKQISIYREILSDGYEEVFRRKAIEKECCDIQDDVI